MKGKKIISLFSLLFLLSSCSSNKPIKEDPNYQAYLQTIQNYHPKIVEIKAQPGQTIELKGVQEFIVYAPSGSKLNIHPYRPPEDSSSVIAREFLRTTKDITLGILPNYFGWKYGSSVLKKAFDSAGTHVQGNYNTGTYTNVGGDQVTGDKIQGDKWNAGSDIVSGTKYTATGDIVGADKTGSDKAGQDIYEPGSDYVGQGKYDNSYNTTSTTSTTTTTYENKKSDNSTTP